MKDLRVFRVLDEIGDDLYREFYSQYMDDKSVSEDDKTKLQAALLGMGRSLTVTKTEDGPDPSGMIDDLCVRVSNFEAQE